MNSRLFFQLLTILLQEEVIPHTPPSEDLPPEKAASIDDNLKESQVILTIEASSLPIGQPRVEDQIEEVAISQHRESKSPSSPPVLNIDNSEDKNAQTEDVEFAVENVRLEEEGENDREILEALNQREEEEEESHREAESKEEEEEESKDGDNRNEEEKESREEEGKAEAKPSEEMENRDEVENSVMEEGEAEAEESKEEESESNPVAEHNSQGKHNTPPGQDEQMDVDHEQNDQTSLGNIAELDIETESEIATPAPEIAASPSSLNPAEAVDDEHTSGDEPVVFTRRAYYGNHSFIPYILNVHFFLGSSRHRKSSATSLLPPPTKKQLRSRGRISELEPQPTVDSENDSEIRDDYPPADDDLISSPFDGSVTRSRDGIVILLCLVSKLRISFLGKRKASFVESAESPPDKKRLREDSEPAEEEDPGMLFPNFFHLT
jgi:bromodomain-containing protein 8